MLLAGVLIIKPPNNSLDILRILLTTSLETDGSTATAVAMAASCSLLLKWPEGEPRRNNKLFPMSQARIKHTLGLTINWYNLKYKIAFFGGRCYMTHPC